ncbi:unnamed protein product [Mytilus edulis]|uniref:Uncharacterized protein n=1 Tax=Mytilus edulis TaxID=6550 RepID=A0A8S3UFH4_MYTED|nr:unnamed protein product [Mytilus edulis]
MYGTFKWYQTANRRIRNILASSLPDIPKENTEGIYEEIDVSNMIDFNLENFKNSSRSVTDKNDSFCKPAESNDYLAPYEPVDEDSISRNSNDNKSDSLANDNDDVTSDYRSITSSSDVHERRSSNLNSYQSIIADINIHEYTFTNIPNEPCPSELDTQTSESCYLNPYEPMITTKDLHEYASPNNLSDGGSRSSLSDRGTKQIGIQFQYPCQTEN